MSRCLRLSSFIAVAFSIALASGIPANAKPAQQAKPQAVTSKKMLKPAVQRPAAREPAREVHVMRAPVREQALIARPGQQASIFAPSMSNSMLITEARKYMGTNPTARKTLWCAAFMNMVLARTGYAGTGSDAAKSFASYGKRVDEPKVGAIAVLTRGKRGGHVGIVTGIDHNGNPIILSGNHNKRVGEAAYNRKRVIAYVMPVGTGGATRLASAEGEGISSPIAELLAAINAERERRRAEPQSKPQVQPQRVAQAPQPPQQQRQNQQPAQPQQVAQRVVQQMPAQAADPRRAPLDPALAAFLGFRDTERERPVARVHGNPQRVASDRNRPERVFFAR